MDASRLHRPAGSIAALALAFAASGCLTGAQHEVTPQRPVISAFTATPTSILPGGTTLLSWSVAGATSLSIDQGVGTVTGTSISVTPSTTTTYTLTATSTAGSSTRSVKVNVGVGPPSGLAYSANPATYTVGAAIAPNTPTSTGGAISSYGVSPPLPAGLSLSATTGVITGTPTTAAARAVYTVTASSPSGSTTVALTLTVVTSGSPTIVSFGATPSSIVSGEIVLLAWDVLGATSLSIDNGVGVVTGTSRSVSPTSTTTYRLSATNALGTSTATATVTVGGGAPTNLAYSNATYVVGTAITPNTPTHTGGAVISYGVSPALPAGLSMSLTTGVISGTPTAATPSTTYTVTATNASGSATANVVLTVIAQPQPGYPVIRQFSATPSSIVDGTSTLLAWDVQGAISLNIEPSIGDVTGATSIEFAPTATTIFTLSATNAVGTTSATVTVTVTYLPPTDLTYSTNPATYTLGTAITPNTPSSLGGVVFSYGVQPALPAGLALDTTTGVIAGTPTAAAATAPYTVTATNPGGFTSVPLVVTVILPVLAITTQPASQSALPPSTATFSVVATGVAPLAYQWRRWDGAAFVPLAGATSASYTTPPLVSPDDDGARFDVVVTDALSRAVTSSPAVLTLRGFVDSFGWMSAARYGHTATLLTSGLVLVAGGTNGTSSLSSAELYDPTSEIFSPAAQMNVAREGHAAVLLDDGFVLVVGGSTVSGGTTTYLASAEIYDPVEDTFTLLPGPGPGWMASARTDFAGVLLASGTVLVVGGFNPTTYPPGAEVWSPPSGPFTATGSMVTGRRYLTATRLANDTVLVAGGRNAAGALATAETYDAFEGIFVPTGPMSTARQSATATLLLSGQVLVAGGLGSSGYLTGAEVYDAGNFSATGSLNVARAYQTATLLLSTGEVLIAGGLGSSGYLAGAEIRDPTSQAFTVVPPMSIPRSQQTATVLLDGRVLLVGGSNGSSALDSAELWTRAP